MVARYRKRFIDQAVRSRFSIKYINTQDLCRYYKLDFWGQLHRNLKRNKKLSIKLYSRRLRLSKRAWRAKQMRSGRFELLKLDNQRFQPRKRVPRYFSIIHNKERFRLYWQLSEHSLRHLMLQPSFSGHQRYVLGSVAHRFAARIDQFLFANRFTATLQDARRLLQRAVFTVNGHLIRRTDQQINFMDLLEFRTETALQLFRRHRYLWLRRLSLSLVSAFQSRWRLLWRKRKTLLKPRSRRSRFKPKWFRTLRIFKRFRREEMEFLFRRPNPRKFLYRQKRVFRDIVNSLRGAGYRLNASKFTPTFWLAFGRYVARRLANVVPKVQWGWRKKRDNLISREILQTSFLTWAKSFVHRSTQNIQMNVGFNFFRGARGSIKLRPKLPGQLFYETPFFIFFLKVPRRTYLPCRASSVLVASSYVRTRLRRAFHESDIARVRPFVACVL